eukprot:scaffold55028_cov57-Phaeocystis_antarctica.AAC.2
MTLTSSVARQPLPNPCASSGQLLAPVRLLAQRVVRPPGCSPAGGAALTTVLSLRVRLGLGLGLEQRLVGVRALDLEVVCQPALTTEWDVASLEGTARRRRARGQLGGHRQREERLRGVDDARAVHAVPHHAEHSQAASCAPEHRELDRVAERERREVDARHGGRLRAAHCEEAGEERRGSRRDRPQPSQH